MRRREFIASIPLISAAAYGQNSPATRVRQLAPSVYCWLGDLKAHEQTNVGWIVFRDYVLVIDANFPWVAPKIIAEIRKTTDKPIRFVFNTHYHADHSYGNIVFVRAGAAVVATEAYAEEFKRYALMDVRDQVKQVRWPLANAGVRFSSRLVFDDGVERVELIRMGPAHTSGDGVAYLPKQGILFVGDLSVNWTHGNNLSDPEANYEGWLRALDQMAKWKLKVVVPAHGDFGTAETLKAQKVYLNAVFQEVKAGIRQAKTATQLVQENDLARYGSFGADAKENADAIRDAYHYYTSRRSISGELWLLATDWNLHKRRHSLQRPDYIKTVADDVRNATTKLEERIEEAGQVEKDTIGALDRDRPAVDSLRFNIQHTIRSR